jgi:outer membrane protein OmpU
MNNSTRNLKMKKLLIASTALVAAAGMASADITISGHAAAGIYSGLGNKDGVAANVLGTSSKDLIKLKANGTVEAVTDAVAKSLATGETILSGTDGVAANTAAVAETFSKDGIYSNAGVDFTMTGATDNGISFSASVNIDAGNEIDAGDFELDGADGGTAGLGAVSMTGTFGTLTFDNSGIDNLYSDATTHDVSYSTTVGSVALTVGHSVGALAADADYAKATSFSAGTTLSGMAFTLTGSETAAGTSASLAMSYALNDTVTITADTDQVAGAESIQTVGASTTLNGVSVSVESANNSTWDVDLGYTAGGFALTYGVDETDGWTATATAALGGGATFQAGVDSNDSTYAGVSFAF